MFVTRWVGTIVTSHGYSNLANPVATLVPTPALLRIDPTTMRVRSFALLAGAVYPH
jgi:hypothetical protein